jgi:hypothetical protein
MPSHEVRSVALEQPGQLRALFPSEHEQVGVTALRQQAYLDAGNAGYDSQLHRRGLTLGP